MRNVNFNQLSAPRVLTPTETPSFISRYPEDEQQMFAHIVFTQHTHNANAHIKFERRCLSNTQQSSYLVGAAFTFHREQFLQI